MSKTAPIRSISRWINILQTINRHGSISITEIAREEAIPYATAFRFVHALIEEGLVEQEPARKRYRPTALVRTLASGYRPRDRMADIGHDHISALTRQIGWPVYISTRVGASMVVRDSTHAEAPLALGYCYPGTALSLFGGATGQVCAAHMPPDEFESAAKEGAGADIQAAVATFGRIRAKGYAANSCRTQLAAPDKTSSIAVPILRAGLPEGVLTMNYAVSAMKRSEAVARYVDVLRTKAGSIARELARSPLPAPGPGTLCPGSA